MTNDEVLTYRTNALPALRFDVQDFKEELVKYEDFKVRLRACSYFFTEHPLLQIAGVVNKAQYQRAVEGEKSLERLAYLGDFQKIKENEDKISNFSDLGKYNVLHEYIFGGIVVGEVEKLGKIVVVEANYDRVSEHQWFAGLMSVFAAGAGTVGIILSGGELTSLIIGGFMGTALPVPISILLRKGLRKEESSIRQIKAMIPFYAEQVGKDIENLPRHVNYLEALCSHIQEAARENITFYPERELNQEEKTSLVKHLETDILRYHVVLSGMQRKLPVLQSVCQEKLASLR